MLPSPTDPLVLSDGSKINPATGEVIKDKKPSRFVAIPSNREAVAEVARVRRRLDDLPAPPKTMNIVSAIFGYTAMGLGDVDIAHAISITIEQVKRIKSSDIYKSITEEFIKGITENDLASVRELIVLNARASAVRMLELADSENEVVALRANESVLDRAGLRPADVIEHRHKMEGGLKIEFIRKETGSDMPAIDVEFEEHGSGS